MSQRQYLYLLDSMRVNKSRDSLRLLEVVTFTSLKNNARNKVHKKLYKQAFPMMEDARTLDMSDLQSQLQGVL